MEGVDQELLGSFLSRAAKGKLNGGESKIIFALLKAALVDGKEGIEYSLYNFQVLTGMQKARVDVALGSLLTRKIVRLHKAKNTIILNRIAHTVRQSKQSMDVKQSEQLNQSKPSTVATKPKTGNPITGFVQGIGRYMPGLKYDTKVYLIEMANAKRMYAKFLLVANTQEASVGLMEDYLRYKLDTDQWFRSNARLPITMLYKHVDQFIAGIKPKTRDDLAFEQTLGRRLCWDAKSRVWIASKVGNEK